ncbi:iron permease FTR1 [Methylobacterium sp. 4-46]|uniref:iron uptake transporter permease EfeU n=1 Tax=unclassified Methylobacterium TaxID=2615210 RepID=UPI000152BFBD|nr:MULTISPECIES: iron uptake transporter permease EfeU [Methylobacterium]ACA15000.1 iron permease FTR1 [Methylobacterium sp. 4-46]WFT80738.1 FTR1 family protein [Methylobacterium nodulans]
MLIAFLIMLREGIEAALIVGIIAGYLAQTGRRAWMPAVWTGVVLAALLCLALGLVLDRVGAEFPQKQQEMVEGAIALLAAGMLSGMVFWMRKAARSVRADLHGAVDAALHRGAFGLVLMAFLAVGREGLESVFFLLATVQQDVGWGVPAGAALGIAASVLVGWGIARGGVRLDLRRFFRWTGIFILFVAAGLIASALRAFHEAGLWNHLQATAFDLSGVLPADTVLGTLLTGIFGYQEAPAWGEVLAYLAFLVPSLWLFLAASPAAVAAPPRPETLHA